MSKQLSKSKSSGKPQEVQRNYFERGDLTDPETRRQVFSTDPKQISIPPAPPFKVVILNSESDVVKE